MLKIISKLLFIEILSIKNNKILNLRCGTLFEGKREIFLHIALIRIICGWDSLSYLLFWLLNKGDKTDIHQRWNIARAPRACSRKKFGRSWKDLCKHYISRFFRIQDPPSPLNKQNKHGLKPPTPPKMLL